MNYPSPAYGGVPAVAAKAGAGKVVIIVASVIIGALVVFGILGIALGVGLGVGLNRSSSSSSSSLTTPTVSCNSSSSYCGCPSTTTTTSARLFSASTTSIGNWPWMAVVNVGSRICSGFLVTPLHVVTAANCVYDKDISTISVYLGVTSRSDTTNRVTRSVTNVTIPSNYSSSSSFYDIAVLRLNQNVTLGSTIGLCCYDDNTSLPTVGQNAVIAGWGQVSLISSPSDSLRQATVQIKDPTTCGLSTNSSVFCAGYGSVETCGADNGGPLMTSYGDYWVCSGVIIGGSGTCYTTGGYTRVSSYAYFIYDATLY